MAKHARLGHNGAEHIPGLRSDRIYGAWAKVGNLKGRIDSDLAAGIEPVVSIMMTQDGIRWADVGAGKHDAAIDEMAKTFKTGSGILIPQHEPDNQKNRQLTGSQIDWASYRKAAERVVQRLRAAGVPKGWRFASNTTGWDRSVIVPGIYEGTQMVAGDRYNWAFTYHNPTGSRWNTFENECAPLVYGVTDLPVAVFETNCMEDPKDPGRKAQWLRDAFAFCKDADLRRMIFFEGDPLVGWRLRSSAPAAAEVAKAAHDPYFAG